MACNDRECSVCYSEAGPFVKLSCSHEFCTGCIKTWYLKGTGTGCPMCRRAVYFKGFHAVRQQWDEDAWDHKCGEALETAMMECISETFELADNFKQKYRREIMEELMDDLKGIEKTYRFLKYEGIAAEDIEYILLDTDDYYSDRKINKFYWLDEPVKDRATLYPYVEKSGPKSARCRALQDEWATMNLLIQIN
jgi:hypothetical protein